HSDADHNRSVLTFAGAAGAVQEAAVRCVALAAARIDLNRHRGVHPRIGACDVVPFVPLGDAALEDCVDLAHRTGEEIWKRCRVPVYFYEAAAKRADLSRLENLRRLSVAQPPDIGDAPRHPTAGAVVVGARKLLIAFNVNLSHATLETACAIARAIRSSGGGLPYVKAMGFPLPSRGLVQVSMNLTDFERTPVGAAYEAVVERARDAGARVAGCEIVGLIPRAAAQGLSPEIEARPEKILENRLSAIEWS
ncbi:MAG: glutamate formimidoyltransferase, partial [Bryobacteraceae bacterium]